MAGGGLSRLAQLRRTVQSVRDGDVAGAAWQLAKSAVLLKIALPLAALVAALLIVLVVVVGALAKVGDAAAQACGSGVEGTPVSLTHQRCGAGRPARPRQRHPDLPSRCGALQSRSPRPVDPRRDQ